MAPERAGPKARGARSHIPQGRLRVTLPTTEIDDLVSLERGGLSTSGLYLYLVGKWGRPSVTSQNSISVDLPLRRISTPIASRREHSHARTGSLKISR